MSEHIFKIISWYVTIKGKRALVCISNSCFREAYSHLHIFLVDANKSVLMDLCLINAILTVVYLRGPVYVLYYSFRTLLRCSRLSDVIGPEAHCYADDTHSSYTWFSSLMMLTLRMRQFPQWRIALKIQGTGWLKDGCYWTMIKLNFELLELVSS